MKLLKFKKQIGFKCLTTKVQYLRRMTCITVFGNCNKFVTGTDVFLMLHSNLGASRTWKIYYEKAVGELAIRKNLAVRNKT